MRYFLEGFLISVISFTTTLIPAVLAAETAPATIVITEIGAYERDNTEWVEIYNFGTASVDLTGWTFWDTDGTRLARHTITLFQGDDFSLAPQEYAIIAEVAATTRAQYLSLDGITIFDSAWDTLKEPGEEIGLNDSAGAIIERFTYLPAPDASLERRDAMLQDYTEANWMEREDGNSIGAANTPGVPADEPPTPEPAPATTTSTPETPSNKSLQPTETVKQYGSGVVVINEFVSDPAEGEEWVELYNNSTEIVDFTKWTLEDGNETATALSGTLAPHQFLVIEKPKGQLNNSGDLVVLTDGTGKTIDRVAYGDWADDFVNDNAPVAKDPMSVARTQDGRDSNNDVLDFATTETPTKGGPNVITNELTKTKPYTNGILRTCGSQDDACGVSTTLMITEFLPNPIGTDADGEFIEVYNPNVLPTSFRDFALRDGSGKTFRSSTLAIPPLTHIALPRTSTNIALNNSGGETVTLLDNDDRVLQTVSFTGSASEGASYARTESGAWRWTNKPTPGTPNNFTIVNNPPIAVIDAEDNALVDTDILFDASDSSDAENDPLTFHWDFGDGEESRAQSPRHSYETAGAYTIVLSVSDHELMSKTAHVIRVLSAPAEADGVGGPAPENFSSLRITEFMPDPEGSDDAEWIELFNAGMEPLALAGVKLDDEEGGSRGYTVTDETILEPGAYRVFGRQETRIALNNTSDEARLFDPFDVALMSVTYDDVPEGASYAVDKNNAWRWTNTPTPGDPNVITPVRERAATVRSAKTPARRTVKPLKTVPLENVRDLDIGDRVQTTGVVAVLPGILGTQIFYIVTPSTTVGIQIYSYNKTFPSLNIGDRVQVTGVLGQAYEELRIRTQEASDINIIESGALTLPATTSINQLTDEYEGALVKIAGTITQRTANKAYLDDGTDELLIYTKEGAAIPRTALANGEHVEAIGILNKTTSGLRLLPRGPEDITITPASSVPGISSKASSRATSSNTLASFLAAAAGTLSSLLVALIAKGWFKRKEEKKFI